MLINKIIREGSHTDNDASDPWINTVTSIESIVARSGYPSDWSDNEKLGDNKESTIKVSSSSLEQQSRSPPSSATVKSPMNGNSVTVVAAASVAATGNSSSGDRNVSRSDAELSKSPPKELSSSPNKHQQPDQNNKRLQASPSRTGDVGIRRFDEPERDRDSRERDSRTEHHHQQRSRSDKQQAPPPPVKDLNRRNNDEPDTSKPHRSSHQNNSRPKSAVPNVISPLLVDVNKDEHIHISKKKKMILIVYFQIAIKEVSRRLWWQW